MRNTVLRKGVCAKLLLLVLLLLVAAESPLAIATAPPIKPGHEDTATDFVARRFTGKAGARAQYAPALPGSRWGLLPISFKDLPGDPAIVLDLRGQRLQPVELDFRPDIVDKLHPQMLTVKIA